ncbi:MAG TPA: FMN-binding negative transcriptional regulator, partial [Polyangiaceae bacterium]|nr:FMN-binding negative transcriptional regulator [Polyangiaceae bacterium]
MDEHDLLYVPKAFREEDPAALFDIVERYSFAPLITASGDGLAVSHVSFYAMRDRGAHGSLFGHLARSNPHCKKLASNPHALAIFTGPHAYVSPC